MDDKNVLEVVPNFVDESEFHILTEEEQEVVIAQLAAEFGVNERKLMNKIDLLILPPISLLYLLAFLDRVNIANAQAYGMSTQLHLVGNQYNVALTVFFVPYVLFEILFNYILKKLRPHVWLSACMTLFGLAMLGQGFVQNYGQLVATRFLLGLFESGAFPGCFYLLSMWYRRAEAQKRFSFFFSTTSLAGSFGGLIAYGVNHISGKRGIDGWRWIYIIEGAVTAFAALAMFFCIVDFPEDAKFLSDKERKFIQAKLALENGRSYTERDMTWRSVAQVLMEWKTLASGVLYFCCVLPVYGYAYFSTTIISGFKYSPVQTQLHSIPPWACTFALSLIVAFASDATRHRFAYVVAMLALGVIGTIMLLAIEVNNYHARYAALFLWIMGAMSSGPLMICWTNINFAGHARRGVSIAFQIGFGNIGGIISPFLFKTSQAPEYRTGAATCLAIFALGIVVALGYFLGVYYENRAKRTDAYIAKWDALDLGVKRSNPDKNPEFVYGY